MSKIQSVQTLIRSSRLIVRTEKPKFYSFNFRSNTSDTFSRYSDQLATASQVGINL